MFGIYLVLGIWLLVIYEGGVKGFDLDELGISGMPRTQGRPR